MTRLYAPWRSPRQETARLFPWQPGGMLPSSVLMVRSRGTRTPRLFWVGLVDMFITLLAGEYVVVKRAPSSSGPLGWIAMTSGHEHRI